MEKKLTMTLADGTKLKNLTLNSSNYVSQTKLTEADFAGKLRTVTVSDGETEETLEHCELVQITQVGKEYWFVIRELSSAEVAFNQLQADLEYVAAMTDVNL